MEVLIPNFHGVGAREAKAKIFRHFRGYPREYWHFECGLNELTHEAYYRGSYLAYAWTGRHLDRPQLPLWLWRLVAALRPLWLSDRLLGVMKLISGLS